MKFIFRFFHSILLLLFIYLIQPAGIGVFTIVYFIWHLKWIDKETYLGLTKNFHEVPDPFNDVIKYKNVWYYLVNKPKPKRSYR